VFPDEVVIYNSGRLPENWTVADLLAKHSSMPHNPNIANAFFRSGQIETWGRGIEKIEAACKAEGRPAPEYVATGIEIRVTFSTPITDAGVGVKVGVNVGDDAITVTQAAILQLMKEDSRATAQTISERIGITRRRVESNIARLKALGLIQRQGSDRKGTWLVK
jgi:ATP-dependent DNA helicase RecG